MNYFNLLELFFISIMILIENAVSGNEVDFNSFPDEFLIGAASSAYQVEGAWNVSGKGESIWDYYSHNHPEAIKDRSNGDVACNSYYKYKEDIAALKKIGVDYYRFSLSWSRILPTGYTNNINKDGVQYYHNILDELEKNDIIPIITIYHWDHPQILEKLGGWLNEEMAYIFSDYAKFVFKEFGHRVKIFGTINEPGMLCTTGYTDLIHAPGHNQSAKGSYLCMQNMLKGHALAYHIYDEEFRDQQNGKIGIVIACVTPYSKNQNDKRSSDIAFEFNCGWQANPIFSRTGDYPAVMKQMIARRSKSQGYYSSRLPKLTSYWVKFIKGTSDFFGLNYYISNIVTSLPISSELNWPNDEGLVRSYDPSWPLAESAPFYTNPKGLSDMLRMIKDKYGNPPIYIMENGVPDGKGTDDTFRINSLHAHMKEMLIAIKEDKCNVKAYTVWSFMDSFEWNFGYTLQFGLVKVDFNDPNLPRTLKKSAFWLQNVLKTRRLQNSTV